MFPSSGSGNSSWGAAHSSFVPMSKRAVAELPYCDCPDCGDFWFQFDNAYLEYVRLQKKEKKPCHLVESISDTEEEDMEEEPPIQITEGPEATKLRRTDTDVLWGPLRPQDGKAPTTSQGRTRTKKSSK